MPSSRHPSPPSRASPPDAAPSPASSASRARRIAGMSPASTPQRFARRSATLSMSASRCRSCAVSRKRRSIIRCASAAYCSRNSPRIRARKRFALSSPPRSGAASPAAGAAGPRSPPSLPRASLPPASLPREPSAAAPVFLPAGAAPSVPAPALAAAAGPRPFPAGDADAPASPAPASKSARSMSCKIKVSMLGICRSFPAGICTPAPCAGQTSEERGVRPCGMLRMI